MHARLVGRVVVLRQRDARLIPFARELDGDRVIVARLVGESGKRAEVTVPESSSRLHLEEGALVLVALALPLPFPDDRASFLPVRDDGRAKHVLLDCFGIYERVPDFGAGDVDGEIGSGDQIVTHARLLPALSERRAAPRFRTP